MPVTVQAVRDSLSRIPGPDGRTPLDRSAALSEIVIQGDKVMFSIAVDPRRAAEFEGLRRAAADAASKVAGVGSVLVSLTAEQAPNASPASAAPAQPHGHSHRQPTQASPDDKKLPGVAHIVAVASGKGGVGKSTTAANFALALKALGLKVGLLDADIYGPSVPRLFNVHGQPEVSEREKLIPMQPFGLKVMSIGFLVDEEAPMVWRGPMVMSAVTQLLRDVEWAPLDVLVVDMPPGTGDAQLTLAQNVPLSGAVIVSTPQDLALIDARRGIAMFQKVQVPILGVVENMSYFVCPNCGSRHDIFAHGGAKAEAERLGVTFLGEVPLTMDIRERSDSGRPIVVSAPESPQTAIYLSIASAVW
ncbi:MAG: Mrp/NBP35 family ATP-binding protein, partial [Ancalomicrobiaceae bacterium]|nr:Mrp/NBP35 family ATP-binding protein [Ancalomicrobiaceae bacterium]